MQGIYQTLLTKFYPEEIVELSAIMVNKGFNKAELFYFAFDRFVKKCDVQKLKIPELLDFDRIKTKNYHLKIDDRGIS
jgi:hypothetical protein